MKLVLASTSPYRRALLERLGLAFVAVPHECDESVVMSGGAAADVVAETLAKAKAESLASAFPDAHILGSDQIVDFEGAVVGKPGSLEAAREQLSRLSGATHRLVTAVALRHPDGRWQSDVVVFQMQMRSLTEAEIRRYTDREKPTDCCGAYKIESGGIALFDRIEGPDFTSITGLPLMRVGQMLRDAGWNVP